MFILQAFLNSINIICYIFFLLVKQATILILHLKLTGAFFAVTPSDNESKTMTLRKSIITARAGCCVNAALPTFKMTSFSDPGVDAPELSPLSVPRKIHIKHFAFYLISQKGPKRHYNNTINYTILTYFYYKRYLKLKIGVENINNF